MKKPEWFEELKNYSSWSDRVSGKNISRQNLVLLGFVDITALSVIVRAEDVLVSTTSLQWSLTDGFVEIGSPILGEKTIYVREVLQRRTLRHVWSPGMMSEDVPLSALTSSQKAWLKAKPAHLGPIPNLPPLIKFAAEARQPSVGNTAYAKPLPLP